MSPSASDSSSTRRSARWRRPLLAFAAALATWSGAVGAQEYSFDWNPRSGDVWVDTWLGDVNRYAGRYRGSFVDELVRYHGAPRALVDELLDEAWAPGDVYMACAMAAVIGRPCRYVAEQWRRHHAEGWGGLAQRLGIQPGSAEFHRLKRGFVPTYDRWGRPIVIDEALKRDFPGRRVGRFEGPPDTDGAGKPRPAGGAGNGVRGDKGKAGKAKAAGTTPAGKEPKSKGHRGEEKGGAKRD